MERYKLLDHTADIEIIAYGEDISALFGNAAYAMFDILVNAEEIYETETFSLHASASSIDELLVAWLSELLYQYETERIVFCRFDINSIDGKGVSALVSGEKIDQSRHEVKTEIKSVTYHQLNVEEIDGGWEAQVVFDV